MARVYNWRNMGLPHQSSKSLFSRHPFRNVTLALVVTLCLPGCDLLTRTLAKKMAQPSAQSESPLQSREQEPEKAPLEEERKQKEENITPSERMQALDLEEASDPPSTSARQTEARARGLFDDRNFSALENLAGELVSTREKNSPLAWKISHFYAGINDRFNETEAGYLNDLQIYDEWAKAYPDSTTRRISFANFMIAYAWEARGAGYASSVTPEGWKLMRERVDVAFKSLTEAREIGVKDPEWYSTMLRIARAKDWSIEESMHLLEESLEKHPDYYEPYDKVATTLLPRWGGAPGAWENFLDQASASSQLGEVLYAYLVIGLVNYGGTRSLESHDIDWEKVKIGLAKMEEMNPESSLYLNYAALLGVYSKDRDFASAYFEKLGDKYIKAVWKTPEKFVDFRTWAKTGEW